MRARPAAVASPPLALALALAGALLSACAPEAPAVFVAASLAEAITEAAARHRAGGGAELRVVSAGSQVLRRQIEAGAPAELFLPASEAHARGGAIEARVERRAVLVCNRAVLAVPDGSAIRSLEGLERAARIVLGTPEVPVGAHAEEMLTRGGALYGAAWEARVRARVRSRELDVAQVRARLEGGEADAAIVYATDLRAGFSAVPLPEGLAPRARYPLVLLRRASPEARAFAAWLEGPEGRALLSARGFEECP